MFFVTLAAGMLWWMVESAHENKFINSSKGQTQ
jgi:hypothetical protein